MWSAEGAGRGGEAKDLLVVAETAYVGRAFAALPHRDGHATAIEDFIGARYLVGQRTCLALVHSRVWARVSASAAVGLRLAAR
jgi:hypothetical protein